MLWCGIYVTVAVVVTIATFVVARRVRAGSVAAPDHPGAISAIAGAMWPLLIIGMTELVLVSWYGRTSKYHESHDLVPLGR